MCAADKVNWLNIYKTWPSKQVIPDVFRSFLILFFFFLLLDFTGTSDGNFSPT